MTRWKEGPSKGETTVRLMLATAILASCTAKPIKTPTVESLNNPETPTSDGFDPEILNPGGEVVTSNGVVEVTPEAQVTPEVLVIPEIQASSTPVENGTSSVPYPVSSEGFAIATGGDQELMRAEVEDMSEGDLSVIENLIKWAIYRGDHNDLLINASGQVVSQREVENYYEANYESKMSVVPGKSWIVAPQNKDTGEFGVAVNDLEQPFISVMPLGVGTIDGFEMVDVETPGWADAQILIPVMDGSSKGHHVIGFTKDGEFVGWRDLANNVDVREVPEVEIPALSVDVQSFIDSNDKLSYDSETGIVMMLMEVDGVESTVEVFRVKEDGNIDLKTTTFDSLQQSEPMDLTVLMNTLRVEPKKGNNLLIDTGERVGWIYREGMWREILLDIEFETNGENIDVLPEIYPDDVTSGRLVEAERLEADDFEEDKKIVLYTYDGAAHDGMAPSLKRGVDKVEEMGIALPFFYMVKFEGMDGVLVTMQIMNEDRTTSFLHMAVDVDTMRLVPDSWRGLISLNKPPGFAPGIGDSCFGAIEVLSDLAISEICSMNLPYAIELEDLMDDWSESGQIPTELERVFSTPNWRSRW